MNAVPCCPHCGAETPDTLTLGDLSVSYNPPEALWKGQKTTLTQSEARLIYMLVRRRRASYDALAILPTGEYCSNDVVRTRICHIRRKFREAALPIVVESIPYYGYEIKVEA